MKRNMLSVAIICFTLALFTCVTNSFAQKTKKPIKYEVTFDPSMKLYEIEAPNYKAGYLQGNRKVDKSKWQVLRLEYEIDSNSKKKNHWAERVEFDWKILVKRHKKGAKPILISKSVTYLEAQTKTSGLSTSLFIRPQVIERYFDGKKLKESDISIKVSVKVNGQRIKVKSGERGAEAFFGKRQKKSVWSYDVPKIANVVNPNTLFLNKSETPFASMQAGSFQVIKQTEAK